MWLRQGKPKRSDDIASIMRECGDYCYACGVGYETLRAAGVGMHVHHTKPFSVVGDKCKKIPLCATCHEIVTALQRHHTRFYAGEAASGK
jgi:hypothetical protein